MDIQIQNEIVRYRIQVNDTYRTEFNGKNTLFLTEFVGLLLGLNVGVAVVGLDVGEDVVSVSFKVCTRCVCEKIIECVWGVVNINICRCIKHSKGYI